MLPTRRCILGVFAHPDDETSCAGGTFSHYAREGVDVYVATATRGEQGSLGTGSQVVARQDLPRVRTVELCTVLQMYGAKPPIFLGYRTLAGPEVQPTVVVDISAYKALKVQALRTYTSQEDARRLAELFERSPLAVEAFHQAYPPVPADVVTTDFWAASATPALLRADYSGVTYDTSRRP